MTKLVYVGFFVWTLEHIAWEFDPPHTVKLELSAPLAPLR